MHLVYVVRKKTMNEVDIKLKLKYNAEILSWLCA